MMNEEITELSAERHYPLRTSTVSLYKPRSCESERDDVFPLDHPDEN